VFVIGRQSSLYSQQFNSLHIVVLETRIKASIAACHSGAVCSALGSFMM
jgi:hypothetical protein